MNEYMLTWGLPVPALTQPELAEELVIAQKDGENFRTSIFAGTLVRARADCKRCEGACRLWFMDDSVADGCLPYLSADHAPIAALRSSIGNLFLVS